MSRRRHACWIRDIVEVRRSREPVAWDEDRLQGTAKWLVGWLTPRADRWDGGPSSSSAFLTSPPRPSPEKNQHSPSCPFDLTHRRPPSISSPSPPPYDCLRFCPLQNLLLTGGLLLRELPAGWSSMPDHLPGHTLLLPQNSGAIRQMVRLANRSHHAFHLVSMLLSRAMRQPGTCLGICVHAAIEEYSFPLLLHESLFRHIDSTVLETLFYCCSFLLSLSSTSLRFFATDTYVQRP